MEFPNNYAFTLNGLGESEQLEVQVINFLAHHVMEEQGHFKFTFSAYSMSKQTFKLQQPFEENKLFLRSCALKNTRAEKIGHRQA